MNDIENLVQSGVSLSRNSSCSCRPNDYGHKLLYFCGKVGKDKLRGDCTCQDVSLIDYFLTSSKVFSYISDFEVKDFSHLFSDVHKQLHITLRIRQPDDSPIYTEQNNEPRIQVRSCPEEKSGDFYLHFSSDPNFQKI